MEQKLNITEILKDKALGTKLWSSLFGDVYFNSASANLVTVSHHKALAKFWRNAKLYDYDEAEPTLFPSKEMRDWSKFAWKKGDVLVSMEGSKILFDRWENEDYTKFLGKIKVLGNSHCYDTANYSLASKEEALEFIKSVEEINNGKLNRETLEIEKSEFKDGDIVVYGKSVAICQKIYKHTLSFYVSLNEMFGLLFNDEVESSEEYRFATEKEKQQLFSALEKEGKAWDSDKKQIVDLNPKVELKPFDKVVVFDELAKKWECSMFSHYSKNYEDKEVITCIGGCTYFKVLPFNEETAKLVGTTNNVKG